MPEQHHHAWLSFGVGLTAPAGPPPAHTRFILLHCACGATTVFPRDNYVLATHAWRAAFERNLYAEGRTLIWEADA